VKTFSRPFSFPHSILGSVFRQIGEKHYCPSNWSFANFYDEEIAIFPHPMQRKSSRTTFPPAGTGSPFFTIPERKIPRTVVPRFDIPNRMRFTQTGFYGTSNNSSPATRRSWTSSNVKLETGLFRFAAERFFAGLGRARVWTPRGICRGSFSENRFSNESAPPGFQRKRKIELASAVPVQSDDTRHKWKTRSTDSVANANTASASTVHLVASRLRIGSNQFVHVQVRGLWNRSFDSPQEQLAGSFCRVVFFQRRSSNAVWRGDGLLLGPKRSRDATEDYR